MTSIKMFQDALDKLRENLGDGLRAADNIENHMEELGFYHKEATKKRKQRKSDFRISDSATKKKIKALLSKLWQELSLLKQLSTQAAKTRVSLEKVESKIDDVIYDQLHDIDFYH